MNIAGMYAKLGRDLVVDTVCKILGGVCTTYVNNHHNFAWKETHFGEEFWVVRKGATPAFPNQLGFIGGSMGDDAVIVEGVDCTMSRAASAVDGPRCRPHHEPDGSPREVRQGRAGQKATAARPRATRRDGGVAQGQGRSRPRWRPRRGAAGLPPAAGGPGVPRPDDQRAPHLESHRRSHVPERNT